jgi:hypothetical protein
VPGDDYDERLRLVIRWIFFVGYPDGVSDEEGDAWYLGTHVQEARTMKGLRRYRTWKLQPAPEAGAGRSLETLNRWNRMTELGFDDWDAWRVAIKESPVDFSPAPWAEKQEGTAAASYVSETIFVGEEPEFDLLAAPPPGA